MDQDKVSILLAVPADEVESLAMDETVQSIASQSYPNSLIETLQVQFAPEIPGGRTAAINAARDQAQGEFLVHTELGVIWDPSKVERQVLRLKEGGEAVGVGSAHRMSIRDSHGRVKQTDFDLIRAVGLRLATLIAPPWRPSALLIQSGVMDALGAYRHMDQQVWEHDIRLAETGLHVELLDDDLAITSGQPTENVGLRRKLFPEAVREPFLKRHLDEVDATTLAVGGNDPSLAQLLLAALHLFNDDLDPSHAICQSLKREHAAASYLHGIIHRREPDFDNAKCWYKRSAAWEGLLEIRDRVQDVLERVLMMPEYGQARDVAFGLKRHLDVTGNWDPSHFVDMCATFRNQETPDEMESVLLDEVQEAEMVGVLDWTYRCAIAS